MTSKQPDNQPYNPLEKRHLGESVARSLLAEPVSPLPPSQRFEGAGVYALYYTGEFPTYATLSAANSGNRFEAPIYVGRAIAAGSRRGGPIDVITPGETLYQRLRQHGQSIDHAENLESSDFRCQYLVVDDIWVPLAETLLIELFWQTAVWNSVLDGFGIHDPGRGRRQQKCSAWDTVHPGRPFAGQLPPNERDSDSWCSELVSWLKT